jgi:hypothetical protein
MDHFNAVHAEMYSNFSPTYLSRSQFMYDVGIHTERCHKTTVLRNILTFKNTIDLIFSSFPMNTM